MEQVVSTAYAESGLCPQTRGAKAAPTRGHSPKAAKRMMGLEPTTFCMANGSWVRPI